MKDSVSFQIPTGSPLSEDAILHLLDQHFPTVHSKMLIGRGDDCAVLKKDNNLCISADMFLENIHFKKEYFYPFETGHKALAVNLSDLAAVGAKPVAFTLCLGLPTWVNMGWLDSFFRGMAELANRYDMALVGGDLSRSANLHISITIFGENQDNRTFLNRGTAKPGDILFVVGSIGLARIGLHELEKNGREAIKKWPAACRAHLSPEPQITAGLMLARAGYNSRPPALMDLSDGIIRDLPRLLDKNKTESDKHLGAHLFLTPQMLNPEQQKYALEMNIDAVEEALLGGEDYALLGACAPDMLFSLQSAITGLWRIGEVSDDGKILCNQKELSHLNGFDHFGIIYN